MGRGGDNFFFGSKLFYFFWALVRVARRERKKYFGMSRVRRCIKFISVFFDLLNILHVHKLSKSKKCNITNN